MNDDKKYIDESGYEWERQLTIPYTSIDSTSKINPLDHKKGLEKLKMLEEL